MADRHGAWWGVAAGAALGVIFPPSVLGAAAAGAAVGGVSGHLARGMSRSDAKELGDYIGPGQAGLVIVGESKVEDAIKHDVTRAEKQTAKELDVDPKDIDKTLRLVLAIYLTAHMAFRLDARVVFPATVAATLLVADAWFDVTTSTTASAATLALAVELPAAAFSLYVAHRVGRRVRELAHLDRVAGPRPPVSDPAHPALPTQSTSPVDE